MNLTEGRRYLVHTDIKSFLMRVPHPQLKQLLRQHIKDRKALVLLFRWLDLIPTGALVALCTRDSARGILSPAG